MNIQLEKPLCVFDLETTGLNISKDRILQIAVLKIHPSGKKEELNMLINPEMNISDSNSAIHGVTNEMVKDAPTFKAAGSEIAAFIGDSDLAGYNSNKFDIPDADIDFQRVGPTFGDEITTKGIQALIIFLTLVVLLISYRYEFKYSLIALIALTHDLLLVFSIYVLLGLEITPSTVIALLTILGYSLYDTVILFDKLNDSIKSSKYSYLTDGSLNKTFNEVLMRSLNTSITSAIPIASILFLGNYLGLSGTLSDFALPLFIGILSGTYSSIFVTVPFLAKIINK